jgi:CRP-like cAMP-binding protein
LAGDENVRILELDRELGLRIPAEDISRARTQLVTRATRLPPGHWNVPRDHEEVGRLGYLILEGRVARDLTLAGTTATELLGEGDVLQPWVSMREDGLVRHRVAWHVLQPLRLAVLDEQLGRKLMQWPQVMSALLERTIKRTQRMSIHAAMLQLSPVETRLLVLFWHLAERWGRVTPNGVVLRLRLPHELLGQLVGCQRASVTTALQHVYTSGELVRRSDGSWLLLGSPPDELARVNWAATGVASAG